MPALDMMSSPIGTVHDLAAVSTRLAIQLYNFSSSLSLSTDDVNEVASQITGLSEALRQLGASIQRNAGIASTQAIKDIDALSAKCREVYGEIENIAPVKHLPDSEDVDQDENETDLTTLTGSWNWESLPRDKLLYLRSVLSVIAGNFGIMSHTLHVGQLIHESRSNGSQAILDHLAMERMQMQSLLVRQNRSMIELNRLHQNYEEHRSLSASADSTCGDGPEAADASDSSETTDTTPGIDGLALIPIKKESVFPSNNLLARVDSAISIPEYETPAYIRRLSRLQVDLVLQQWTNVVPKSNDAPLAIKDTAASEDELSPLQLERRKSQQATVESDEETDIESPRRGPGSVLDYTGPVLQHRSEPRRAPTSPIGIPGAAAERRGSVSSFPSKMTQSSLPSPQAWVPTFNPYQTPPLRSAVQFPGLDRTKSLPATPSRFPSGPGSLISNNSSIEEYPRDDLQIPYRLYLGPSYWDFIDDIVIHSNSNVRPADARRNRNTKTEIRETWVHPQALQERGLQWRRISRNVNSYDHKRTKLQSFYLIDRPLRFEDVAELVERSSLIIQAHQAQLQEEQRQQARRRPSDPSRRGSVSRPRNEPDFGRPGSGRTSSSSLHVPSWSPREADLHEIMDEYDRRHERPRGSKASSREGSREGSRSSSARRTSEPHHRERRNSDPQHDRERRPSLRRPDGRDQSTDRNEPKERKRRGSSTVKVFAESIGVATLLSGLAEAMR